MANNFFILMGEHTIIFGTGVLHLIQINHQPDATGRPDHENSTTITTIRR